jgi:ketosteroid isomerase-like protein
MYLLSMDNTNIFWIGALIVASSCRLPALDDVPMTSPEDELVMTMYDWTDAYVKRDTATVGQFVVDSILVHAADGRHVWVTRQGLNQFLIETPKVSWEIEGIDYVGHSDGKDVVVVRGREQRRYADGRLFDEHLAEFFAWKGGRIVEVTQYRRTP